MSAPPAVAFKLADAPAWAAARAAGVFHGSALDLADGYIHLSSPAQLAGTARRHYAGRDDLVLLAVDLTRCGDAVRWEPSRGGELFPHLYAPLEVAAVTSERALVVDADGAMIFADGGPAWA